MKRNTVKELGRRVLSLMLVFTLFMQTMPLATMAAGEEVGERIREQEGPAFTQIDEQALKEGATQNDSNEIKEDVEQTKEQEPVPEEGSDISDEIEKSEAENETVAGLEEPKTELQTDSIASNKAAEGTIQITDAKQLENGVPAGSTYILVNDIVMDADQQINRVDGVLDGAGHTVTLNGKAFVKELSGTIQNLLVNGKASLQEGEASVACVVNGGTIQNCASTVKINPGFAFSLGGIAGKVENGKIYNSYFAGSAKDEFGLPVNYGILHSSNNQDAPSIVKNCYYSDGTDVGGGFAWNKTDESNGKKKIAEMQTPEFVKLLNASSLGIGYIWAEQEGALPKLVAGGDVVEQTDKSALETTIKEAQAKNESDFTSETWLAMKQALNKAKDVYGKIDASQEEVDAAEKELRKAIEELAEKVRELSPVEPPKNGVVLISNQQELMKIDGADTKKFYQLTKDIEIAGNYVSPNLAGVLDGNGHTITVRTPSSIFGDIVETGVVQNLYVKVEGNFTNRQEYAPFAEKLKGGLIVNCISEVTGQHSAGYVRKMEGGTMANCLTMGHNRRGAFVFFQKSTDHRNTNGYKSGKLYNCYWSASNSVENITPSENLVECESIGDEKLRSEQFIAQLNAKKGKFGASWGRGNNGYPYFGEDKGDVIIDGSKNRYEVQFAWHDAQVTTLKDGQLTLSPQATNSSRFAGTLSLKNVPEDSKITWVCDDRSNQEIMQLSENGELYVFHDGGGVVQAIEHKADGTQELAAELRVVSASREIQELRLLLHGTVIENEAIIQGSAIEQLEIQAKYLDEKEFKPLPTYLVTLQAEKPNLLMTDYNSGFFYFTAPGTSKLTVTEKTQKENPVSVTVSVTSEYVPIKSLRPAMSGVVDIHYRNAMGSGEFVTFPQTVFVEPANASYKNNVAVESSNPEIAKYDGSGYIPFKNGTVTFTAKIEQNGSVIEGKSEATFVYTNPLSEVLAPEETLVIEQGDKQILPLVFKGQPDSKHEITEPNLVWSFDKPGIVSIQRPDALVQVRETGGPDDGNWVASKKFELKALRPGTVVATGTPVDSTGEAKPIQLTIKVNGKGAEVQKFDIPGFIQTGKQAASSYLNAHNSFVFGEEWSIFTLMRAGQTLPQDKLQEYYRDAVSTAKSWKKDILATEVERTAIAFNMMGKDISNADGVNLVELICNHPDLTKQGSNALAWALIALDMNNTEIPTQMKWSRELLVEELLKYQKKDGGFGLDKTGASEIDMTAMSVQALAPYQNQAKVAEAIEKAMKYLAAATEKNLNLGNAESISQVIIALGVLKRDMVQQAGFGDEMENMMSVLAEYMVQGQGFKHDKNGAVDKMASAQAMQALCAYERFLNGESGYWDLKGTGAAQSPADKVSEMIAALPDAITTQNAQDVKEARKAYEALSKEQKAMVKNLDRLVNAEKFLADIQAVQQAIDALPANITLADAHSVKTVREAYNRLSVSQRKQILNLDKLKNAEAVLKNLANAKNLISMIDALPDSITLADQAAVLAARAAYDLLTEQEKEKVSNFTKLKDAENQLENLNNEQQVKKVIEAIDTLPENITLADEPLVISVRKTFEKLSENQKKKVNNIHKLVKAEKEINDQKEATKVEKMIEDIPEEVAIVDEQTVQAARKEYDSLSDEQKALVKNLNKLTQAEEKIKDLNAAQKVMKMIKELPSDITVAHESQVKAARIAYNDLTEVQKKLVLNLYLLERTEKNLAEKKSIKEVEDAINALPENITEADVEALKRARAAYNRLSPELRKKVANAEKLMRAEKALRALHQPIEMPGGITVTESNTIKAVVKDGMVSAEQVTKIKGKEMVLRAEGIMENGEGYTMFLYGKDVAQAEAFCVEIKRESVYAEKIHKLAENPEVFSMLHKGAYPGPVMVQMGTRLDDGEYLLLRYDPNEQRAELVTRVKAENGVIHFIVEEGGAYFLAKKASKKSVPELDAEKDTQEETKTNNESIKEPDNTDAAETAASQTSSDNVFIWVGALCLILVAGGVAAVMKKGKGKKSE